MVLTFAYQIAHSMQLRVIDSTHLGKYTPSRLLTVELLIDIVCIASNANSLARLAEVSRDVHPENSFCLGSHHS